MALRQTCAVFGCAALLLTGCNVMSLPANSFKEVNGITTTADYRLVTERPGPFGKTIVCTEPSPDIARGISEALKGSGSYKGASGELEYTRNEAIVQLGKRYATVQLLREMLYRDCELYGNGIINQAEYAMKLSRFDAMVVTLLGIEMVSGDSASAPQSPAKQGDTPAIISTTLKDAATASQASATAVDQAQKSMSDAATKVKGSTNQKVTDAKKALDTAMSAVEQTQLKVDAAMIRAYVAGGKDDKAATDAIKQASDAGKTVDPNTSTIKDVATTAKAVQDDSTTPAIPAEAKTAIQTAATDTTKAAKTLTDAIAKLGEIDPAIKKAAGSSQPSGNPPDGDGKGRSISNAQASAVQTMQKEYLDSQGLGPVTVACAMALDRSTSTGVGSAGGIAMGLRSIRVGIESLPADRKVSAQIMNLFVTGQGAIQNNLDGIENKDLRSIIRSGLDLIKGATDINIGSPLPDDNVKSINAGLRLIDHQENSSWAKFCEHEMDDIVWNGRRKADGTISPPGPWDKRMMRPLVVE